ncbi:hypothetical protein [Aquimarina pacifica]|uniref:hypothetical protein n=1 Tax=Aquimarina pacifica TaxID=1296415 RepID=UPI0004726A00|nr:hypothetical protein [Aquimarina pacifica]
MMRQNIVLKKNPKIEFQLLDTGFQLIDEQTEQNSGFYSYSDLKSIELNNIWFPRLANWLKIFTWIFNGVPFFPDAETCKKANVNIHFEKIKLGVWLTDSYMTNKAKKLKKLLDIKTNIKFNTNFGKVY